MCLYQISMNQLFAALMLQSPPLILVFTNTSGSPSVMTIIILNPNANTPIFLGYQCIVITQNTSLAQTVITMPFPQAFWFTVVAIVAPLHQCTSKVLANALCHAYKTASRLYQPINSSTSPCQSPQSSLGSVLWAQFQMDFAMFTCF